MNIAAYCRVSTDKEDQQNSLAVQKAFFIEYATKHNYNLAGIYPDEGLSGTSTKKRVEFNRMINDAGKGKIDLVVTKEVSRFARNTVDTLNYTRLLKSMGVGVLFLSDNINTLDNDGELRLSIMATLAQEESRKISARVKWGKRQAAKKGSVPTIIYGYDKIKSNSYEMLINEHEAEIIRKIYAMYLDKGDGATKIAITLNSEGFKTKRGCGWSQNAVCRILTNPIYTGKIINSKEEIADFLTGKRIKITEENRYITYKPELRIIDDALFERVQAELDKRRIDFVCYKERQSNKHLFSTLIKCTDCGYSYSRRKTKDSRPKWHCTSRNVKGRDNCTNRTILGERELISELNNYFMNLITDKRAVIDKLTADFKKQYGEKETAKTEKSLLNKLTKLNAKRENYIEMRANGLIEMQELKYKLDIIKKEREPIEERLAELQNKSIKAKNIDEVLQKTILNLENIINVQNLDNAQLKELIDRIEAGIDGSVNIYMKTLGERNLSENFYIDDNHTSRYNSKA
jgi:DNA invertase Pin-like site-specific DNA recombinase